jgi:hypothetical protein
MGKDREYGEYTDANEAALARYYAAKLVASMTGGRTLQLNTTYFVMEDRAEMDPLRKWIFGMVASPSQRQTRHGVYEIKKTHGETQYSVRISGRSHQIEFGTFLDEDFACLVADYVFSEFL